MTPQEQEDALKGSMDVLVDSMTGAMVDMGAIMCGIIFGIIGCCCLTFFLYYFAIVKPAENRRRQAFVAAARVNNAKPKAEMSDGKKAGGLAGQDGAAREDGEAPASSDEIETIEIEKAAI